MSLLYKSETKMTPEIVDYIQKCRQHGVAHEMILSNLRGAGWDEKSIRDSFASLSTAPAGYTAVRPKTRIPKKLMLAVGGLVVILALAGVGYAIYSKSTSSPEKIWAAAITNAQTQQSGTFKFAITYRETLPQVPEGANEIDFSGDLSLLANGTSAFQKNGETLDSEIKSEITAKLEDFEFGFDVESRKIGNDYFYKIDGNPLAALGGLGDTVTGTGGQWYRQELSANSQTQNAIKTVDQIQLFLKNADVIKLEKYLGTEDIDTEPLEHFQASIDRTQLISSLNDMSFAKIAGKLDFHKAEVWIGRKDSLVRRIVFETNFPGFVGGFMAAEEENAPRDVQRLTDVLLTMSALDGYQKTNNKYPTGANGLPDLPPGIVPFAPKPADGNCTAEQNLYWYEPTADFQSYQLKFCLGGSTEGYQAGVLTASPSGITPKAYESTVIADKNKLENLPLNGTLELILNFSGYNEAQTITEPPNAVLQKPAPANTGTLDPEDLKVEDLTPQEF